MTKQEYSKLIEFYEGQYLLSAQRQIPDFLNLIRKSGAYGATFVDGNRDLFSSLTNADELKAKAFEVVDIEANYRYFYRMVMRQIPAIERMLRDKFDALVSYCSRMNYTLPDGATYTNVLIKLKEAATAPDEPDTAPQENAPELVLKKRKGKAKQEEEEK